jgi:hypothetical protein
MFSTRVHTIPSDAAEPETNLAHPNGPRSKIHLSLFGVEVLLLNPKSWCALGKNFIGQGLKSKMFAHGASSFLVIKLEHAEKKY